MDGRYLVKESFIFQLWSVYCTVKPRCEEKEICCHPQGILFAEAITFCQCNTSSGFATEPIRCALKTCSAIQAASQTKPHIWMCITWSWSHPKAHSKALTFLWYSVLQGRKQLGVLHAGALCHVWIFIMKSHYQSCFNLWIFNTFLLFEVAN